MLVILTIFFPLPCSRRGRKALEMLCTAMTLVSRVLCRACMAWAPEVSRDEMPALLIRTSRPRPERSWLVFWKADWMLDLSTTSSWTWWARPYEALICSSRAAGGDGLRDVAMMVLTDEAGA